MTTSLKHHTLLAGLVFACVLIAPRPAAIAQESGNLTVHVADSAGGSIPGAFVMVHWEPIDTSPIPNIGIREDIVGRTDRSGRLVVSVPEGFYDILVVWRALGPDSQRIRVDRGKPAVHRVRLQMAPIMADVIGGVYVPPAK